MRAARSIPTRSPLAALSALGLLLTACPEGLPKLACDGPPKSTAEVDGLLSPGTLSNASLSPTRRPVHRRHVALVDKSPTDPCPTSAGWAAAPLFRAGEVQGLLGKNKTLPKALERFCLYTWAGSGSPSSPPTFTPADHVVRVDADREIVVPQSASPRLADDPGLQSALREAFLGALGALPDATMDPALHASVEGTARIAVIDTADFADGGSMTAGASPHLRHGLAVAEIARDVRCPKGQAECREKLFHAQAFPYDASSPLPQAGGGPLGSLGSLAHAIGEALVRWQSGDMRTSPLVLNLSLGWDPRFGADLTAPGQENLHVDLLTSPTASVPATIQAVHAILSYASCMDVLTIAASGNRSGDPCQEQGGLAPAIWERYPAIDPAICSALFDPLPTPRAGDPSVAVSSPSLLYAASGVDDHGAPIALTRAGSLARRLLPADHALAGDGPTQTGSWTGTSVAAASLSAISALLWTKHRVLQSHQVMAIIEQSGTTTAHPVAIGRSPSGTAKQISAHAAFDRVCAIQGNACTNPYRPAGISATVAQRLDTPILAALAAAPDVPAQPITLTCAQTQVTCAGQTQAQTRCEPTSASQGAASPSVLGDPWVRPQPDIPICSECPIRGGKLLLSLNPEHTGGSVTIQNPILDLTLVNGSLVRGSLSSVTVGATEVEVDLSRYRVSVGGQITTLADLTMPGQASSASLTFTVTDAAGAPAQLISGVSLP
ncbi:MAG: hypothetical protein R3B09_13925 [Nannocystaceae bacterium]